MELYIIEFEIDYQPSWFWRGSSFGDLSECKAYSTEKGAKIALNNIKKHKSRYNISGSIKDLKIVKISTD